MAVEKRSFRMHPKLLFDVIRRQAGTVGKAMLEGVMNSADAGAKSCDIILTTDKLSIKDDGKGFRSKAEIEQWFEQFGTPHEESEGKVYGTFRMGRGQIFAFGVNSWASANFRMLVDIKDKGLDYNLDCEASHVEGCTIQVELYKHMLPSELNEAIKEIEKMAKYVSLKLTINGKQINVDPADEKWDVITDEAYIRFKETTSLAVYNLGVWVKDFGNWQYGCGGTVVSRKQLVLNFARNDVMASECSVWRKIRKVVDQRATDANKRKPVLDDGERQRLATQVVDGDIDKAEAAKLKLITDVSGKHWSADQVYRCRQGDVVTSADKGNLIGDKLMQAGTCFVFASETLERFDMSLVELVRLVSKLTGGYWKPKVKTFGEMTKGMDDKHVVLDKRQWTPKEKTFVELVSYHYRDLLWGFIGRGRGNDFCNDYNEVMSRRRDVLVGSSKSADAWTDGSSYIVLSREYLRGLHLDLSGILDLFDVALHEYCHDDADNGTHVHSQEFYQSFHDAIKGSRMASLAAFKSLPAVLERQGRALGKQLLRQQDTEAKGGRARQNNRLVVGEEAQPEEAPVAAKAVEPMPAAADGNPYRATSGYGILFALGSQRHWERQGLLEAAARATGKDAKLVANDLNVLMNPNHASNKGRSKAERDGNGNVKLVAT